MKKHVPLFLVMAGIAQFTAAQTYHSFPTDSASWDVVRCWYFYPGGWHDEFRFTMDGTDTLHNGQVFKKLYVSQHHAPGTAYDTIYPTSFYGGLREYAKQIFIWQNWPSVDTTVWLVYDFNHENIGDTIYTYALTGNPNPFGHIVVGKDSVMVGSAYHTRLQLISPDSMGAEYWIEGVGSSWGLPYATFWSATDNSYDLTCFYQEGNLKYGNSAPGYGYCQAPLPAITCVTTGIEDGVEKLHFRIFPNPTTSEVQLNFGNPLEENQDYELTIVDLHGKIMVQKRWIKGDVTVDVSALSTGIYFVQLNNQTGQVGRAKLMVQ
jgi:hypothetical protein